LSTSDIEALRHISNGVNLIPVIAKADTLTLDELRELKILIRQIIEVQDIKICEHIEDEQVRSKILEHVPYSVIGSESYVLREDGKSVRGRKYHWGIAEVDNEDHCDFTKLKDTLLSTNMIDLICSTESYYQRCRVKLLKARIHEARDKLKDGELLKGFDFEDIDKNGLRNYQVLSKINKSFVDDLAIEWNPIFIQRQLAQRKKFNEIVEFEENKFKEWKKALFSKQNLMNQGIEQMRKEVKVLNEIVHDLQRPIVLKGVVSHSVEDECILDPPGSSSAVLIGVN
jgi:sporulation-regulated protein 3